MNTEWVHRKIGEVCTVERGGSPRPIDKYITDNSDGINWIKIGDTTDSMFITQTAQKIRPEGMKKSRYVQPGDFLLSNSMSFGRPYILKIDGCIHDGWLVLRDNGGIFDKRFLYYYLSSKTTYQKFKQMAVGGVVNNLNSDMVRQVDIPIPTIKEQTKVADLLDQVNSIIEKRKQQLLAFNDLIKARFVEMFGDPETNPKGWKKAQLKNHANVLVGYPFPSEGYTAEGIDIVGGYNLMQGYIQWEDSKHWQGHEGFEQYLLKDNDIVMAMDRPWVNGGFKIARVDGTHLPALLIQRTACIRSIDVDQTFLYYMLDSNRFAEHCNITGSLVPHISNKDINSFEIILPPKEEQEQFAAFVSQIDKSKSAIQQSLDKTQLLFDSLMQEYFG